MLLNVGLIITMIATYTQKYDDLLSAVAEQEENVAALKEDDNKDRGAIRQAIKLLTKLKAQLNLAKTFLDFWLEALKDFIQLVKKTQELAFNR